MATEEKTPVDKDNLYEILGRLRDLRAWAVVNDADPWAFRQAMITIMAIDTTVALDSGIKLKEIVKFDVEAKFKAQEFIDSIPKEGG